MTDKHVNKTTIRILGFSLMISCFVVVYLLYSLWPSGVDKWEKASYVFGQMVELGDNQRIILLVVLSGLLGSFVHTMNSFSSFVGGNQFEKSWIWWYVLRPFVGMSIALIFYLVFRAGLFAGGAVAQDLNIYGILTLAALTGLFSDRATLKLEEVFENLFRPKDERRGKLEKENKKPS
ncbi:MAG: hypothetical protein ABJG78_04350 [Cyclobacteriaceae bacterium]